MITVDAHFKDDYARVSMQKIFNMIGVNHVLAKKYRDTLSRTAH
ncbi:MAG: tetratricopeptide repeat protein [Acidiferrobacterales bacterium]